MRKIFMSRLKKYSNVGKYILKWIGRTLSFLAIIFIGRKIVTMEFDYSLIFAPTSLLLIACLTIVQTALIFVACKAWENYLDVLDNSIQNRKLIRLVYSKANLYKYIPGNVFQYIGRNDLAVKTSISHKNVVFATIADTVTMVIIKVIVSLLLLQNQLFNVIKKYVRSEILIYFFIGGMIFVFVGVAIIVCKKINLRFLIKFKNSIWRSLLDYLCVDCISGIMYIVVICIILNYSCTIRELLLLIGGYTLASIIGFLTPGAPGGIGIREAVIIFLSHSVISSDLLTTAAVIMRIICVFADIIAFVIAFVMYNNKKLQVSE